MRPSTIVRSYKTSNRSLATKPRRCCRKIAHMPRPLFVCTGTLARRHDPTLLLDLAKSIECVDGHVSVVTDGEGGALRNTIEAGTAPANLSLPASNLPADSRKFLRVPMCWCDPGVGRGPVQRPEDTEPSVCRALRSGVDAVEQCGGTFTHVTCHAGLLAEPGDRDGVLLARNGTRLRRRATTGTWI